MAQVEIARTVLDQGRGQARTVDGGHDQDIGPAAGFARLDFQLTGDVRDAVDHILANLVAKIDRPDADRPVPAGEAPVVGRLGDVGNEIAHQGLKLPTLDNDLIELGGSPGSGGLRGLLRGDRAGRECKGQGQNGGQGRHGNPADSRALP